MHTNDVKPVKKSPNKKEKEKGNEREIKTKKKDFTANFDVIAFLQRKKPNDV